jgi:hypothetical protein
LSERQTRSMKTLSIQRPRPSIEMRMPAVWSRPVKAVLVNCAPWSVLNISGLPPKFLDSQRFCRPPIVRRWSSNRIKPPNLERLSVQHRRRRFRSSNHLANAIFALSKLSSTHGLMAAVRYVANGNSFNVKKVKSFSHVISTTHGHGVM